MSEDMTYKPRCAYCGEERPLSELKPFKIFFKDRRPGGKAFVNNSTKLYCADKGCGGFDQMAHEG